jgi:hypothetical protein
MGLSFTPIGCDPFHLWITEISIKSYEIRTLFYAFTSSEMGA